VRRRKRCLCRRGRPLILTACLRRRKYTRREGGRGKGREGKREGGREGDNTDGKRKKRGKRTNGTGKRPPQKKGNGQISINATGQRLAAIKSSSTRWQAAGYCTVVAGQLPVVAGQLPAVDQVTWLTGYRLLAIRHWLPAIDCWLLNSRLMLH
jgi:hypothetical protein